MDNFQNLENLHSKIGELEKKVKFLEEEKSFFENKYHEILTDHNEEIDPETKSKKYKFATVLYSDVKGLTQLAQLHDAETLIDELDRFYFHFDTVIDKFDIKRIKSIGDTYLCAGGFPEKNKTNPIQVVMVAFEMLQYLRKIQTEAEQKNIKLWDITFGIHTGPVLVNKQGKKKDIYEISGDTINIASRIEASCNIGAISISTKTYDNVKEFFVCEYKGKMPVKYKGELQLYFVKGYRPELSVDGKGLMPNEKFWTKYQMLSYDDLNETIINYLDENLPGELKYYDIKHTIDVSIAVEIIGSNEGLSDEDLLILKTAALFHDSGLIYSVKNHEERSAEIADLFLPKAGYNKSQIDKIAKLILATKNPLKCDSILEKIICDADCEYIGKPDLIDILKNKFSDYKREFHELNFFDFLTKQKEIIQSFDFYTQSAKDLKIVDKQSQIDLINDELKKLT